MNNKYSMKLGKEARIRNAIANGCIEITQEAIDKIPCIKVFIDNEINKKLQERIKEVLHTSKNRIDKYLYGEVGILLNLREMESIKAKIYGDYNGINTSNSREYMSTIENSMKETLVFIHNHPNGSALSYEDIYTFVSTDSVKTLVAVGNNGNVYIINKDMYYDESKVKNFLRTHWISLSIADNHRRDPIYYRNKSVNELLKNYESFGFDYIVRR